MLDLVIFLTSSTTYILKGLVMHARTAPAVPSSAIKQFITELAILFSSIGLHEPRKLHASTASQSQNAVELPEYSAMLSNSPLLTHIQRMAIVSVDFAGTILNDIYLKLNQ